MEVGREASWSIRALLNARLRVSGYGGTSPSGSAEKAKPSSRTTTSASAGQSFLLDQQDAKSIDSAGVDRHLADASPGLGRFNYRPPHLQESPTRRSSRSPRPSRCPTSEAGTQLPPAGSQLPPTTRSATEYRRSCFLPAASMSANTSSVLGARTGLGRSSNPHDGSSVSVTGLWS